MVYLEVPASVHIRHSAAVHVIYTCSIKKSKHSLQIRVLPTAKLWLKYGHENRNCGSLILK